MIKIAYNISNLSDARYFAAYGFDWIIFNFGPGAQEHKHLLYGISEWISGAKIGIHVESAEELKYHINNHPEISGFWLHPDLLIDHQDGDHTYFSENNHPFLTNFYHVLSEPEEISECEKTIFDLTSIDPETLELADLKSSGIAISGTEEDRPGFKSYGNMEGWMDKIEESEL